MHQNSAEGRLQRLWACCLRCQNWFCCRSDQTVKHPSVASSLVTCWQHWEQLLDKQHLCKDCHANSDRMQLLAQPREQEHVVEEALANLQKPPVDLSELREQPSALPPFQRVAATGQYAHDKAMFVGPRPLGFEPQDGRSRLALRSLLAGSTNAHKNGYLLVTPLVDAPRQQAVLVNRGWVPPGWHDNWDSAELQQLQPTGKVQVTGVVQGSENPSGFVPENHADTGRFHWVDVPGMAEACGLPAGTPMLQLHTDPRGNKREQPSTSGDNVFPLPKPQTALVKFPTMPQDHAGYATMWGGMAAVMGYMAVQFVRRGGR